MPKKPGTVCPTCRQARPAGGRCPRCYVPWSNPPASWAGGSTRRWRKLRLVQLRANPFCQWPECGVPAQEVDHVVPLAVAPDRRYDLSNLQSLCTPHHRAKTVAERGSK